MLITCICSVCSSADDRTLKLWDAVAGSEITSLQGHSGVIRNARFNPVTMQVVSASEDCTVKVILLIFVFFLVIVIVICFMITMRSITNAW